MKLAELGVSEGHVDGLEIVDKLDLGEEGGLLTFSKFEFLPGFLKASKPEIRFRNSSETT